MIRQFTAGDLWIPEAVDSRHLALQLRKQFMNWVCVGGRLVAGAVRLTLDPLFSLGFWIFVVLNI